MPSVVGLRIQGGGVLGYGLKGQRSLGFSEV